MRVGIDFGTSNTSVAKLTSDGPELIELEEGETSIPTAIFYHGSGRSYLIGNEALAVYQEGEEGRLMRSIKSVLGSDLIDETTQLTGRTIPFRQVISDFLKRLLEQVEASTGEKVTEVVQGRPVSFNDDDPELDQRAQRVLGECLAAAGIPAVSFLYEPVAAARSVQFSDNTARLAFVVDIGGGTSDFSLIRLEGAEGFEVLASDGVYIGGNDFDRLLSFFELTPLFGRLETLELNGLPVPSASYTLLSDWKRLNLLYAPAVRKEVEWMVKFSPASLGIRAFDYMIKNFEAGLYAQKTEALKIGLSQDEMAHFDYRFGPNVRDKHVTRQAFNELISELLAPMMETAQTCIRTSGEDAENITDIIMVGGSTFVPAVEGMFLTAFPNAQVSANDRFAAVAKGLARHML